MIAVKELLAMIVTAAVWGPYWTGWISITRTYHREIDLSDDLPCDRFLPITPRFPTGLTPNSKPLDPKFN